MSHALHDPVRHNAWATAQILEFCRRLDEQTLNASVPGTYGTIIATQGQGWRLPLPSREELWTRATSFAGLARLKGEDTSER
jgi:hypothetical protein